MTQKSNDRTTTNIMNLEPTFEQILFERFSRRGALTALMKTAGSVAILSGSGAALSSCGDGDDVSAMTTSLTFKEIPHSYDVTHHVADGYSADILVRWGDQIVPEGSFPFSPQKLTPEGQAVQFGYNNDFIAFNSLPLGSDNSDHGLLVVNHEFPVARLMFPGYRADASHQKMDSNDVFVEMQSVGVSIVEIKKTNGGWSYQSNSGYNRRITATTEIEITGPAAGHERLKTTGDPTGRMVKGTLFNCAGGVTPWGTILTAEENFNFFFSGNLAQVEKMDFKEVRNLKEFGIGYYSKLDQRGDNVQPQNPLPMQWHEHDDRFDVGLNPREPNRFGYLVEIDPYSPKSIPKKRTALGRFKHESASVFVKNKKPVVVYSGDDERFQFVYKFVSHENYRKDDFEQNVNLLENGDLFAAKFFPNGRGRWIKLQLGEGDTSPEMIGLESHAEVCIETRLVARALGATPMDRPEDIETDPNTERVYLTLTENKKLLPDQANAANPRPENLWGHIVEILPPGEDGVRDHWSDEFEWDILLLAGDPNHSQAAKRGVYHTDLSDDGWFQNPDNLAFDPFGRMWIASDGLPNHKDTNGKPAPVHDGLWACEITGPKRALTKHFFGCPRGAEMCGPCFTPDGKTLFVAVQHPGLESGSHFDKPTTRWPDFDPKMPPRPSVLVITKKDGDVIGS